MDYDLKRVAKNIKLLRVQRNWKFRYIEKNTEIDEERLRKFELAKLIPTHEELYRLSRLYEITIDDLVFKELE